MQDAAAENGWMQVDLDDVLALGSRLAQEPDKKAYPKAAHHELLGLIPADDALWIQAVDRHGSGCVAERGEPFEIDADLSRDLCRLWTRHVIPRWQTAHPLERTPFRVSDLIAPRQWRENEVFRELRSAMPQYQPTISPPPPARYRGWVITRQGRDFSDEDVEVATRVAPVLATLGLMYDRLEPSPVVVDRIENQPALTGRELSVLGLLVEGLSAHAIGRRLGISERTISKHLQHIYRKLDCNDRLIAVALARELRLLPCGPDRG